MSFLSLMVKNPFRNRTRAALAIVGIAIGIATIVVLGMITGGLQSATTSTLKAGAAEITVTPIGSSGFGAVGGTLNESLATSLQNITGVSSTAGILQLSSNITGASNSSSSGFGEGLLINGINSNELSLEGIDSINGFFFYKWKLK